MSIVELQERGRHRASERPRRVEPSRGELRLMRATAVVAAAVSIISVILLMTGLGT
jgi:hypothetical protein